MITTTTTSRQQRSNSDCPKCGGHLWWNDEVFLIRERHVGKRHWWSTPGPCHEACPEGEHVHRHDRCFTGCGYSQMRVEAPRDGRDAEASGG